MKIGDQLLGAEERIPAPQVKPGLGKWFSRCGPHTRSLLEMQILRLQRRPDKLWGGVQKSVITSLPGLLLLTNAWEPLTEMNHNVTL